MQAASSDDSGSLLLLDDSLRWLLQCNRHAQSAEASTSAAANASTPGGGNLSASAGSSGIPGGGLAPSATATLRVRIPSTESRVESDSKKPYTVFLIQLIACCSSLSENNTHHAAQGRQARNSG